MSSAGIVVPETVKDAGIRRNVLEELALKTLFMQGELSLVELANQMHLSLAIVRDLFEHLRKGLLCEVKGMVEGVHLITTTSQGRARALELLSLNQYWGPAPVSLEDYIRQVRAQSVRDIEVHADAVKKAFRHLVLTDETLNQLGTAMVSGKSIFLHGPTGTGKTAIAETLPRIYDDYVWIPYAVDVDGQTITVFDPHLHESVDELAWGDGDGRWVLCRRPRVVAGGELTLEMLDLQFNPTTKFYAAPHQMKANNGVLIVDDFGRQRIRPEELLNRWIVPLDRRIDFLTLAGGKKFEIPFDLFVVFATNLDPRELADEAFLRRIQTKVKVDYVSAEQFDEISRRVCAEFGLSCDAEVFEELRCVISRRKQPLRACYPRDIVQHLRWAARYEGQEPQVNLAAIERACCSYFLSA
jgi:predicted ATPase with chaperone activity